VVPSDGGPHRKYYGINAQGREMLTTQRADWAAFATTMTGLLDGKRPTKLRTIGEN
jgi:PadR family transcriptional regulator PadR